MKPKQRQFDGKPKPDRITRRGFAAGSAALAMGLAGCSGDGGGNVAEFNVKPFSYAAYSDLLAHADRFEGRDDAVCLYFRLRGFEALGAFDEVGMLRVRETEGLTDEEQNYLSTM